MRTLTIGTALICWGLLQTAAFAMDYQVPMDQQINVGLGNAILPDDKTPAGLDKISFNSEGGVGFTRMHLIADNGMKDYYTGPWVDLVRAGIGPIDLSQAGAHIEFDARYFQAPEDYVPGTPWVDHDAPIGVFLMSALGERDFGYPYHSLFGDPPYPTWTHIVLDPHVASLPKVGMSDIGPFDLRRVTSIGFWGTDWPGQGNDFVDVKSLQFSASAIPEPGTAVLLVGALLALLLVRGRLWSRR